jgi:hypothetical protein
VGIAAELDADAGDRRGREIRGHHGGGPAEERERRGEHAAMADRHELGNAPARLLAQDHDRVDAVGRRLPEGMGGPRRLAARRPAASSGGYGHVESIPRAPLTVSRARM